MKPHIPADIDALMWSVAESGDDQAIQEFGERYVQYRLELLKRMEMVRQLKGAKPEHAFVASPPKFSPRPSSAPIGLRKWAWVVAPAVLAGIAFGSYSVAVQFMNPAPLPPKSSNPPIVTSLEGYPDPIPDGDPAPDLQADPLIPRIGEPNESVSLVAYDKPVSLKFEKIALHAAIDAIARTANLTIEIAPGLEDFDISMTYMNMPSLSVLKDMGRNFGFTVFEQGESRLLLVPEVDPRSQAGEPIEPVSPSSKAIRPETAPGIRPNTTTSPN